MDIVNSTLGVQKRRRQRLLAGAAGAAVMALAGVVWSLGPALPEAESSSLWVGTVERNDLLLEVRASGTLVPRSSRWLAAATTAQVLEIFVLPGAEVEADTVLMRLSNPEVEDSLRNAQFEATAAEADVNAKRAELASTLLDMRAALAKAKAEYSSAGVKHEADARAAELQLIARVQFEQGRIAYGQLGERVEIEQDRVTGFAANIKAQMEAVMARAEQQRSTLVLRQRQADALEVKAGINGVLQEVVVQEGLQVTSGGNLARVARPDDLIARLQVSELQAKDVALGMPVVIDTHNGVAEGEVARIDPAVRSGSVQVDVALTGELPDGARPDLSVDGRIRVSLLRDVLSVGRPALAQANRESSFFRLDDSGNIASRVPVGVGAVSVDRVQLVRGLKEGDKIILSDTSQWDEYDRIRLK